MKRCLTCAHIVGAHALYVGVCHVPTCECLHAKYAKETNMDTSASTVTGAADDE